MTDDQPPAEPDQRRREHRRAVRVLVIDPDDRMLLFLDSDLGLDPVRHWWVTPGGGVNPGETNVGAAQRELAEETGLKVEAGDLIGPLASRHVLHGYSDKIVHQDEVYFAVRVPALELDFSGHTAEEQLTIADHRWWPRAELATTSDDVWPRSWRQLWAAVDAWPSGLLHLTSTEESTVPSGQGSRPRSR